VAAINEKFAAHAQIIEKWILSNIQRGTYSDYDDLHIDQIDSVWRSRSLWVGAGVESFRTAVRIRNKHHPSLTIALAFSLVGASQPLGLDFQTRDQFEAQLNPSPPSLYLFKSGEEPWSTVSRRDDPATQMLVLREIEWKAIFGDVDVVKRSLYVVKRSLYMEFRQKPLEEYARSVFLVG
jgi:hypothetical protein